MSCCLLPLEVLAYSGVHPKKVDDIKLGREVGTSNSLGVMRC